MIKLDQPSMVCNAICNPPIARYQMWNTYDVPASHSAANIIENIRTVASTAPGGQLKNLVLQCHGEPGALGLGSGFEISNSDLFERLRGRIGMIWIIACHVARIGDQYPTSPGYFCHNDGNVFVSMIASAAQCPVGAPTGIQDNRPQTYPAGHIPEYEGEVLLYGPHGNVVDTRRGNPDWSPGRSSPD